ncbi:hypothetical protein ACET3Z_030988 [Daucus carota]
MSGAIHDKSRTGVTVLNCLNWFKEEYSVSSFFRGYTEGRLDFSGWPQMLKLNDWPQSGSFEDHLTRHNVEFLSALPFKEYTHPQSGYLIEPCCQVTRGQQRNVAFIGAFTFALIRNSP